MTDKQRLIYDFFVKIMKTSEEVTFPLAIIEQLSRSYLGEIDEQPCINFPNREETVKAWNDIDVGKNEPIYQAIKTIKEMKSGDVDGK